MAWEVVITSPLTAADGHYCLAGKAASGEGSPEGSSVRVRSLATGWTEELFLDPDGGFNHTLELAGENGTGRELELTVCDEQGREAACVTLRILELASEAGEPTNGRPQPGQSPSLDPPWATCLQRVRQCLHLAAGVAHATGRNRDELLQYVHAQERYAEQALKENNRLLYHECLENLEKYADYLEQVQQAARPRPPQTAPRFCEEDAREALDRLRSDLATIWKDARTRGRSDLESDLKQVAAEAQGLGRRSKTDAAGASDETTRLLAVLDSIKQRMSGTGESEASPGPAPEPPTIEGGQPQADNDSR
jgi:hypothetical protein